MKNHRPNLLKSVSCLILSLILLISCSQEEVLLAELDADLSLLEIRLDQTLAFGIDFNVDTLKAIQSTARNLQSEKSAVLAQMIDGLLERNDNEKAITHYLGALELAETSNYDFGQGLLYEYIGKKYKGIGEYNSVSRFFHLSLAKWKSLDNQLRVGHMYNQLALESERKRQLDSAIYYFENARNIFKQLSHEKSIVATNEMLARSYVFKGKSEDAIALGKESIVLGKQLGTKWESSAHQDLAIIYNQVGNPKDAIRHFDIAFSFQDTTLSTRHFARFFQARSYFRLGDIANAEQNMDQVLRDTKMEEGNNYKRLKADIFDLKATIRQQTGNYNEAIDLLKQKERLLGEIHFSNQQREATREAGKYQAFRAKQELEKGKLREQEQARINILLTGSAAIFAVLLLVIIVFYVRKRKDAIRIVSKNEVISKSLSERESLLKEIHHRVKNNLQIIASLLYLQSGKFEDEDIKKVLEEGQGRVRSMALIHQKLYENEDLKSIPFGEYLQELVSEIRASFGMDKIQLNIEASNVYFDVDTAVPLGLIVNEIATNAFKYAFLKKSEGMLSISLTEENEQYALNVKDNGSGIPEEVDIRKTKSLGLRLVRMLSQQLEGDFEFSVENGTAFELKFAA